MNTADCFFFKILKWKRSSLLSRLLMSGSGWRRKYCILAQVLSTQLLKMTSERVKSSWASIVYFLYQLVPDIRRLVRRLDCLPLNILKKKQSTVFNLTYIHIYIYTCVVLFTNPSARAGYDTRSIFKRSLTGLNSEFSFS